LIFLDGELWFGRTTFNQGITLSKESKKWKFFKFITFDNPEASHHEIPFENRYKILMTGVVINHSFLIISPRMMCKGNYHMKAFVNEIMRGKGEGVILRQPHSFYEQGSSKLVLKLKNFIDEEALITQIKRSKYTCLTADGITFRTRMIEEDVQKKIKINDVISYKYTHNSKPLLPRIHQIRHELTWNDVLARRTQFPSTIITGKKRKWKDPREQRKFFDEFAMFQKNFNPLDASQWYLTSHKEVIKGVCLICCCFFGSNFKYAISSYICN